MLLMAFSDISEFQLILLDHITQLFTDDGTELRQQVYNTEKRSPTTDP